MTIIYLIIPYLWLVRIRGFELKDLGITRDNLLHSILLGLGVYSIALVVFIVYLGGAGHDRSLGEFLAITAMIAWMAALTDIWTRGMILMPVLKVRDVYTAVIVQNIFWFSAHIYEIEFLTADLTLTGAVLLTLSLGLLGDLAAIKTKNILGLCAGHVALNLIFLSYIQFT
jgi:hypothetical protein